MLNTIKNFSTGTYRGSSHRRYSVRKNVLRNFAKFAEKHLQAEAFNFTNTETLAQGFSCEICKISKNTFSYNPSGGCFWCCPTLCISSNLNNKSNLITIKTTIEWHNFLTAILRCSVSSKQLLLSALKYLKYLKLHCFRILTGKNCVLFQSVQEWLVDYFWPFSYVYTIN